MFDHFDFLAPIYDRAIPFARVEKMLDLLELPADGRLLDVGGGTGRVSSALKPYIRDVIVADFSRGMLKQAAEKKMIVLQSFAEKMPFADGSFDRIIMIDALHHVHHQKKTLLEMWRLLKTGGLIVIEEPDIRTWQVKILAVVEKIALMRSYFLSPPSIKALLPPEARVEIQTEGFNAWLKISK